MEWDLRFEMVDHCNEGDYKSAAKIVIQNIDDLDDTDASLVSNYFADNPEVLLDVAEELSSKFKKFYYRLFDSLIVYRFLERLLDASKH